MLKKALFFIAWIGIFIISIIGIIFSIHPLDNRLFFTYTIGESQQIYVVFLVVSIIYFILSLMKFMSLFKRTNGYLIDGPNGEVLVSTESIRSIIKEALESDDEVKNLKINCGKSGKKYKITLYIDLHTQRSIAEKSAEIQKIVKDELFKRLELEISVVEIKISKISTKSE
ncbi:alkaline shock response membrane anchor protein AmaP [Fusobacterium sp.]|uniref:alkaline shock response membrane anchor protein AmaP n=1 Tax=Fusobacterium sp. TaxID=68766 RepID=UPI002617D455|nr:alkaline shock response membrane anchor protein AmaP [Fusobacterium sp.]